MSFFRIERAVLLASFVGLAGCATLLGGLEEGVARDFDSKDDSAIPDSAFDAGLSDQQSEPFDEAPLPLPLPQTWLEGFRKRRALRIAYLGVPIPKYQVRIADFAPGTLGFARSDHADIRVALGDGSTIVPYWLAGPAGDESELWARIDLDGSGDQRAFIYWDNPDATNDASLEDTFVAGIVDNPRFERQASWTVMLAGELEEPSPTNISSAVIKDGQAQFRFSRKKAHLNGAVIGLCQPLNFPEEPTVGYRLQFDVITTQADDGGPIAIWLNDPTGDNRIWQPSPPILGFSVGESFRNSPRGAITACIGAALGSANVAGSTEVAYQNIRVRRYIDADPRAQLDGNEEERPP